MDTARQVEFNVPESIVVGRRRGGRPQLDEPGRRCVDGQPVSPAAEARETEAFLAIEVLSRAAAQIEAQQERALLVGVAADGRAGGGGHGNSSRLTGADVGTRATRTRSRGEGRRSRMTATHREHRA